MKSVKLLTRCFIENRHPIELKQPEHPNIGCSFLSLRVLKTCLRSNLNDKTIKINHKINYKKGKNIKNTIDRHIKW